jgi:hypothetical protein
LGAWLLGWRYVRGLESGTCQPSNLLGMDGRLQAARVPASTAFRHYFTLHKKKIRRFAESGVIAPKHCFSIRERFDMSFRSFGASLEVNQ